jgi:glucose-1-phosphate adenylyltransferase
VSSSVLLPGSVVGRNAIVRRAILDKNVIVPDGATIGVDQARDAQLYTVSDNGVVVLGKNTRAVL